MKYDDFTWDDIVLEAPEDDFEEDELSASDYTDAEGMDIEEDDLGDLDEGGGEDELSAADYTGEEDAAADPADEDPLADDTTGEDELGGEEDPLAGEGDPADEDPLAGDGDAEGGDDEPLAGDPADEDPLADDAGEGSDENPEDKQTDNTESDVVSDKQNKNLVNDYIELYRRIDEIMNQIRTDCKTNIRYNPNMLVVRRNLEKLKLITYDYIVNKFAKETYVANLYQFNLIIQALNTNIELLGSVLASNRKFKEGKDKKKKNETKKSEPKKKQ
jgi:hypothetical protein